MVDEPKLEGVSDGDLQAAFGGPAFASNRFFVTISSGGTRIAFTEQWKDGQPPLFRCAAILSFEDGIRLKNLLSKMLKPIEDQINSINQDGSPENG
jgi:hypothetical protein